MSDNPLFLVVAIGGFNAGSSYWCINDKNNYEGIKTDSLAIQYDLKQVINELTHLLENFSSYTDLIFTSQQNCHHQIVYAKFNLKIHYPPPYGREVWNFQNADINLIRKAMNGFNCERAFFNLNINEVLSFCNTNIKNVMENGDFHSA